MEDTGIPGHMELHKFKTENGQVRGYVIAHFGTYLNERDVHHFTEDWYYTNIPSGGTRHITDVHLTRPKPGLPFAYLEIHMGMVSVGILSWKSKTLATIERFSVSYRGPCQSNEKYEHAWFIYGIGAIVLLTLILVVIIVCRRPMYVIRR